MLDPDQIESMVRVAGISYHRSPLTKKLSGLLLALGLDRNREVRNRTGE